MSAPTKVLITGISGFVGRHLASECASQGALVMGLGRSPEFGLGLPEGVEMYMQCDLLDGGQIEQALQSSRPDRIFHLAAEASVAHSWEEPKSIMLANLTTTFNLLEAARRHVSEARILWVGSGEEYGFAEQLPVTESAALRPINPYAVSKVAADHLAGFYHDAYGVQVVRARPFNHAGPGQSATYVVSGFARQIAEAEADEPGGVFDIATGNLDSRRDFTDARDIARAYWLALEHCEPGVYNVCSERAISVSSILDGLKGMAKVELRQHTDPRRVRPNEVKEIFGSSERLREATGWRPQVSLERTLSDTLDWWRERARAARAKAEE